MIRLGIVDFDSSHSIEFTRRLNHKGIAEGQWVNGAQVVMGCALPSAITEPARVEQYVKTFREEQGLPLVARPEDMIGKVDGVLIESVDGSVHLERARPFLEAGIPTYVDKPFTCSVADAKELIALAERKKLPLFSSSSLRYAPEVTNLQSGGCHSGAVVGAEAYSPGSRDVRNPGLFNYGIHGVETLYAMMGPGCETVTCTSTDGVDVAVGRWKDGRVGSVRAIRKGGTGFGVTAYCADKVVPLVIGTQYIYRELLKRIVQFFETKQSPLDIRETLEITAFMEGALQSAADGGAVKRLNL
jgi:predicted dehydrogenase